MSGFSSSKPGDHVLPQPLGVVGVAGDEQVERGPAAAVVAAAGAAAEPAGRERERCCGGNRDRGAETQ